MVLCIACTLNAHVRSRVRKPRSCWARGARNSDKQLMNACVVSFAATRRCSQDIVEVPSHLWEHFATDTRSLALLARHKGSSRQPLPPQLAQQLTQQASATPALELQQQASGSGGHCTLQLQSLARASALLTRWALHALLTVPCCTQQALLSLVDLVYHGATSPASAGGTSAVWATLARQHASLPPPADVHPQVRRSARGSRAQQMLLPHTRPQHLCAHSIAWRRHVLLPPFASVRTLLILLKRRASAT